MLKMKSMDIEEGERFNEESWVSLVESSLEGETRPDKSHYGLIHTVPKSLLSENTRVFYLPQVISFGPYHFPKVDAQGDDMELLKSEVAREIHLEIVKKGRSEGLKLMVEKFKKKEVQEELKLSYAQEATLKFGNEACAWMIVRDACFVLEVLDRFAKRYSDKSVVVSIDSILSKKGRYHMLTEIVKDMLKMENQLPLWALMDIRQDIKGSKDDDDDDLWFSSALINLSPIEAGRPYPRHCSHILSVLHEYIVDENNEKAVGMAFLGRLRYLCDPEIYIKWLFRPLGYAIILVLMFPVFVIWGIIFAFWYDIKNHIPLEEEMGTAEKLTRVGVKFKNLEDCGISHIKFQESNSTLYLPKFKVDYRSEVIIRNLIALEICSQEEQKPFTRYISLMNDLINNSRDVRILRREGIITSKLQSDDEIAQLWNSMVIPTEMPRYASIDEAAASIDCYRQKSWKALWAQFVWLLIDFTMVYCSKPWLFLSLLAGVVLLVLTLVQVICLFEPCQAK